MPDSKKQPWIKPLIQQFGTVNEMWTYGIAKAKDHELERLIKIRQAAEKTNSPHLSRKFGTP